MDLDILKSKILEIVSKIENPDWARCIIVYEFAPFINKGFISLPSFWDSNETKLDFYLKYDLDLNFMFYKFIFQSKTINNSNFNQLKFSTNRGDYENATIEISFNQEVEDNFRNNLPKSWRKKTIVPWWKNPEETKGLE